MAKATKKASTKARDKRLRRTAQQTREAGLRAPVSVRLTPEERASLESYAQMRGMSLSEAIRSRACHYSPDGEKAAEYAKDLYYGMRENGAELMESNRQVRIAYEENARKVFGLSAAVNRVGVNVNQIARRVNAGAVGDDAERWLSELQYCVQILNEILEKGGVSEIRAIPPLMGGGVSTSTEASDASQNASENRVEKAPEKKVVEVFEKASADPVENDAKKDAEIESDARAEKKAETKSKTDVKSTVKPKQKKGEKPKPENAEEPKSETVVEEMPEASSESKREPVKGSIVDAMTAAAKAAPEEPPASDHERVIPVADESRGETQEDVDAAWAEGLLAKPEKSKGKRKRRDDDDEISPEWRARYEEQFYPRTLKGGR